MNPNPNNNGEYKTRKVPALFGASLTEMTQTPPTYSENDITVVLNIGTNSVWFLKEQGFTRFQNLDLYNLNQQ